MLAVSAELTQDQLKVLNKQFKKADDNNNGLVTFKEFQTMVERNLKRGKQSTKGTTPSRL